MGSPRQLPTDLRSDVHEACSRPSYAPRAARDAATQSMGACAFRSSIAFERADCALACCTFVHWSAKPR